MSIMMTIEVSPAQAVEIAKLLGGAAPAPAQNVPAAPQPMQVQQAPVVPPVASPAPQQNIPAAVSQVTAPVTPPPVQVPPVAVREYTMDELALASRPVCEAGRQAELLNLLHSFTFTDGAGNTQNVQSIQQLPKESYPAFANGIRALGGKI